MNYATVATGVAPSFPKALAMAALHITIGSAIFKLRLRLPLNEEEMILFSHDRLDSHRLSVTMADI